MGGEETDRHRRIMPKEMWQKEQWAGLCWHGKIEVNWQIKLVKLAGEISDR